MSRKNTLVIGNEKNSSGNLSRSTRPSCLLLKALTLLPSVGVAPSSCLVPLSSAGFKVWLSFPNCPLHRDSKRSSHSPLFFFFFFGHLSIPIVGTEIDKVINGCRLNMKTLKCWYSLSLVFMQISALLEPVCTGS